MMPFLFALTLFLSAALLFLVQPMVGRMLLPSLGGSPAVWNTCLVFFQAILLLGYLYAHISSRCLTLRVQAMVHLALLAVPFLLLPIAVDPTRLPDPDAPASWLLVTLCLMVGLPFFALSATGPLLQKWFAASGDPSAQDPYYLYAASNLGSLLALIAYPLAVETWLPLSRQSWYWEWLYAGFLALCSFCALVVVRSAGTHPSSPAEPSSPVNWKSALRWIGLAFIPSSLLMGVTSHISTDLAPVPLLWVVPLALYLLSFIIAFSQSRTLAIKWVARILAISIIASSLVILIGATEPIGVIVLIHLVTLFLAALLCHGMLAKERPPTQQLTAFYLLLAVGGVLGGGFNALLAPVIFHKLGLIEYPFMLVIVSSLGRAPTWRPRISDLAIPLIVLLLLSLLVMAAQSNLRLINWFQSLAARSGLQFHIVRNAVLFGVPAVLVYTFVDRPLRFALGIAALFLASAFDPGPMGDTLFLERNYLGVVRVTEDSDHKFHRMIHGNTIHGQQRLLPKPSFVASCVRPLASANPMQLAMICQAEAEAWSRPSEPLTYYHPTGPAGQVFRTLVWPSPAMKRVGVVGLGIGTLAAYARSDQDWTFFELDPAVIRLAWNAQYFTFLRDCRAKSLEIIAGDARLRLEQQPDHSFDVLVLDAFSSDAIPIHLLTTEAMKLYQRKLAPDGILLFHVSNRYLDLIPILGRLAEACEPALYARVYDEREITDVMKNEGKNPSIWILMVQKPKAFGRLARSWSKIRVVGDTPLWSDDRANVLDALNGLKDEK